MYLKKSFYYLNYSGPPTHVRVGVLDYRSHTNDVEPQDIAVVNAIRHGQHSTLHHYNDIALLELAHNIVITRFVAPACLYLDPGTTPDILTGTTWGRTKQDVPHSTHLMEVVLHKVLTSKCSQSYRTSRRMPLGIIEETQLCAGTSQENGLDMCSGSAGAPLQVKLNSNTNSVVGISSSGIGCNSAPGVYTRVSHFLDWIEERAFIYG